MRPRQAADTTYEPPDSEANATLLSVKNVSMSFRNNEVLHNIDLEMVEGEKVAILGPSGSGKSTFLAIVSGFLDPSQGTVSIQGKSTAQERTASIAFMPQSDMLFPWLNAIDNVALAFTNQGIKRATARELALPLVERAGLTSSAFLRINQLSGGMKQRLAFLRTLAANKSLMVLDEPFGALDSIVKARMQVWLRETLLTTASSLLLVTHDVDEAIYLSDRVVVLATDPGEIVLDANVDFDRGGERRIAITRKEFISLKLRVLQALEGGMK